MIHVIAIVTTQPGQREKVLELFKVNAPKVHTEDGCIEYGAVVDVENGPAFQAKFGPDSFLVVEKWENVAALEQHGSGPIMKAYGALTKGMIASRSIHILQDI